MEVFGEMLQPYSDDLAKIAVTVTCLQFLSGFFLINDIRKKGKSDTYSPDIFIGGVVLTILCLKLGTLIGDEATINVNIIGFAVYVIFTVIFYWYASGPYKMKIWSRIGLAAIFTMTCLAYANFEDPAKIEFRFGMLITAILVIFVGLPLLSLGEVIETKSTECLPFPMILSGTLVSVSWALYGISIRNHIIMYQNIFLLLLGVIELSLFVIYPGTPNTKSSEKATRSPTSLEHKNSTVKAGGPSKSDSNKKYD